MAADEVAGAASAEVLLGKGRYGRVVAFPSRPNLCLKLFGRDIESADRERLLLHHIAAVFARNEGALEAASACLALPRRFIDRSVLGGRPDLAAVMLRYDMTLEQIVADKGRLDDTELWILQRSATEGLRWLHNELGIVWGDCKASNILRAPDGTWRLADFGLWRPNLPSVPRVCMHAVQMRAPELLLGVPDDAALWLSDWWALGITLQYADLGAYPVRVVSADAMLRAHQRIYGDNGTGFSPAMEAELARRGLRVEPRGVLPLTHRSKHYAAYLRVDPHDRANGVPLSETCRCTPERPTIPRFDGRAEPHLRATRQTLVDALCAVCQHHRVACRLVIASITMIDAAIQRGGHETHGPAIPAAALLFCDNLLIECDYNAPIDTIAAEVYSHAAKERPLRVEPPTDIISACTLWMRGLFPERLLPFGSAAWESRFDSVDTALIAMRHPDTFYESMNG